MGNSKLMRTLAMGVDSVLTHSAPDTKFCLLVWDSNRDDPEHPTMYIGNGGREDTEGVLQEMLTRWNVPHRKD